MNYYDYVTVTTESGEVFYPTLAQFEHVTLEGDWYAPVADTVCHTAIINSGWEGSQP